MDGALHVVLEAHVRCATLYLRGPLTDAVLRRALALCGALPPAVCDLRIDARGVDALDAWSTAALRALARAWRVTGAFAEPRGAVTISLHDRGAHETRSLDLPRALETVRATPMGVVPPP